MSDDNRPKRLSEDQIEQILARSGPRPRPSAEVQEQIRQNVREVWQEEVEANRRRRRWTPGLALAASLFVAIVGSWLILGPDPTPAPILAQIEASSGAVEQFDETTGGWLPVARDLSGDSRRIRTGKEAMLAVTLMTGFDIRLDADSEVTINREGNIALARGAVYIDSDAATGDQIVVTTGYGRVTDIGTQFEVRQKDDEWRVQVREGLVDIGTGANDTTRARAGERINLKADALVGRESVPPYDASWQWAQAIAPAHDIDGESLAAYLSWFSRETGKTVEFSNTAARAQAESTILHGSIDALTPEASLTAVLATTDFKLVDSETGRVVISK